MSGVGAAAAAPPPAATEPTGAGSQWWSRAAAHMVEANVAVVTVPRGALGLVFGAVLIIVTTPVTLHAWGNFGSDPWHAFAQSFSTVGTAYGDLFTGSIISPSALSHAMSSGPRLDHGVHADLGDAGRRDPADHRRDRGRARLLDRRVQHRRPGPADRRRDRRDVCRFRRSTCRSRCTCRW